MFLFWKHVSLIGAILISIKEIYHADVKQLIGLKDFGLNWIYADYISISDFYIRVPIKINTNLYLNILLNNNP